MSEQRQETNTGTQSTNLSIRPLLIEILIFLDSLDITLLFFLLSRSYLLAILCRVFVLYLSIAIWISQGLVLSSLHSILISWVFFLYIPPPPREFRVFHLNPAPRHKLSRTSESPPQLDSTTSLRREHSLQGCPSWWSQRRPLGSCWRGQEPRAGMHTGGSVAHVTASFKGFLNHSNGSFIICIMDTHVHISSLLLKLYCVCIAKF